MEEGDVELDVVVVEVPDDAKVVAFVVVVDYESFEIEIDLASFAAAVFDLAEIVVVVVALTFVAVVVGAVASFAVVLVEAEAFLAYASFVAAVVELDSSFVVVEIVVVEVALPMVVLVDS